MRCELVFHCSACGALDRIRHDDADVSAAAQALIRSVSEQRWRLRRGSGNELWCGACTYEFASARVPVGRSRRASA